MFLQRFRRRLTAEIKQKTPGLSTEGKVVFIISLFVLISALLGGMIF